MSLEYLDHLVSMTHWHPDAPLNAAIASAYLDDDLRLSVDTG
jgi:hypothetical protein